VLTGVSRKLHSEELHNLYFLPSIIKMIKTRRVGWEGHAAHMGDAYKALAKETEGKKPVGRLRGKWEDNIEMDLQEAGLKGVE
jgi:hypothetical protein